MKVLAIDHNAVSKSSRQKYNELARIDGIQVVVVAPKYLDWELRRDYFQKKGGEENFKLISISPILGKFKSHRGILNPLILAWHLQREKPDIVFIDAEPEAWYATETILLKKIIVPSAKIFLTTWMNINVFQIGYPYMFGFLYKWLYRYAIKNAQGILCYTSEAEDQLRINGFSGRIDRIVWGVDTERFTKLDSSKLRFRLGLSDRFVIGYCGRFIKEKGIFTLMQAFEKIRGKVALILIGSGPIKASIEQFASETKLDIQIIAAIDNDSMPLYYNCMDVFVLPSLTTRYWKEQFGRVLIEAMACGVPVVGSSSGEIPYVIQEAGIVFEEGNENDLAGKIESLMASTEVRRELSLKGRLRVEKHFRWAAIAKDMGSFLTTSVATDAC